MSGWLPYPRRGDFRYSVLAQEDVARLAAGLRSLQGWAAASEERSAAEGLVHLAAQALSREELTLYVVTLKCRLTVPEASRGIAPNKTDRHGVLLSHCNVQAWPIFKLPIILF